MYRSDKTITGLPGPDVVWILREIFRALNHKLRDCSMTIKGFDGWCFQAVRVMKSQFYRSPKRLISKSDQRIETLKK